MKASELFNGFVFETDAQKLAFPTGPIAIWPLVGAGLFLDWQKGYTSSMHWSCDIPDHLYRKIKKKSPHW